MRQPPWKSLVERLEKRDDFSSPYLDRLSGRVGSYVRDHSIEREIVEEMAYSLTRSGDKLNAALLELDLARHEASSARDPKQRRAKIDEHNRLREKAQQARWELIVHREAIGLYRHDVIDDDFPIPPALRPEDLAPPDPASVRTSEPET